MRFIAIFAILLTNLFTFSSVDNPRPVKYWIFFRDKLALDHPFKKELLHSLPSATIKRRLKNVPSDEVVDLYDALLSNTYLELLSNEKVRIVARSKWLNAVSAELDQEQLSRVRKLHFVAGIKRVAKMRQETATEISGAFSSERTDPFTFPPSIADYGSSARQDCTINLIRTHQLGYSGKGVKIGLIDTGFNLDHQAFDSLHVIKQYDFVDNDSDASEGATGNKQPFSHGMLALSMISSYDPGNMIGSAFGADYLLTRVSNANLTEEESEDHWIEALEWLEENGADIVSSSISFFDDFDNSTDNYTLSDLDGKTALTTRAASIAFDKGVLVFNSAGNMGDRGPRYLGTPSDGKKMIAVGAIYGDSTRASFSSYGPTADGRIKPDVAAPGFNVLVVNNSSRSSYGYESGTSLSTPLVAGLAALALEANPLWSAKQLYDAVRKTSSLASHPNNEIGYGIPDAVRALNYNASGMSSIPLKNLVNYPNPANPTVYIRFTPLVTSSFSLSVYNALGERIVTLARSQPVIANLEIQPLVWNGKDARGRSVSSGVYFYRITLDGRSLTKKILIVK